MDHSDSLRLRPRRPLGELALGAARGLLPALKVAVVVGTTLCLVNHTFTSGPWYRVGLNYLVPFAVSTWSRVSLLRAIEREKERSHAS